MNNDNLINKVPTVQVRKSLLQQTVYQLVNEHPRLKRLAPIMQPLVDNQWHITVGQRTLSIHLPEHGEYGGYHIMISGDPLPLIKSGVDTYANQFRFHRTSGKEEPLAFTIEWQGGDPKFDADATSYFLQSLLNLLLSQQRLTNILQ